jgi:hypothetical protein
MHLHRPSRTLLAPSLSRPVALGPIGARRRDEEFAHYAYVWLMAAPTIAHERSAGAGCAYNLRDGIFSLGQVAMRGCWGRKAYLMGLIGVFLRSLDAACPGIFARTYCS